MEENKRTEKLFQFSLVIISSILGPIIVYLIKKHDEAKELKAEQTPAIVGSTVHDFFSLGSSLASPIIYLAGIVLVLVILRIIMKAFDIFDIFHF